MSDPTDQNMNGSMPEGSEVWAKYKDALNQANTGTEALESRLKTLGGVVSELGPQFAGLGEFIGSRANLLLLAVTTAADGMQKVFDHVQKIQDQFHSLIEEGQRINDRVHNLVNDQPSETEARIGLTDQLARLHEQPDRSWAQEDQFTTAQKETDQQLVDEAPDAQKPARKRQVITDEIANTQAAVERDVAKGTNVDAAQIKVNQTRQAEEHLEKQMRELPDIIATLKQNAADAKATSKSTWWPSLSEKEYQLQQDQIAQAARLQAQLDKANVQFPAAANAAADAGNQLKNTQQNNGRIQELNERLITLGNQLGAFDNSRDGKTLKQQIQGIIDQNQGTGDNIREMGDKLHLSQQQLADLATRIITRQKTIQNTIDGLHQRLDEQAQQITAMPNSNR